MNTLLTIKNLTVSITDKKILQNISLSVAPGSTHLLMGSNGSGKTTFARAVAGDPSCTIISGSIFFAGKTIAKVSPDERARAGLFLAFQHPCEIPGLTVFSFLREAYNARFATVIGAQQFRDLLYKKMELLNIDTTFAFRDVNSGFSGGEKKRLELLQLFVLQPKIAILDEIDSGLDFDALELFVNGIGKFKKEHPQASFLFISHNQQFANQVQPDLVHIFSNGSINYSGPATALQKIQQGGYESFI